MAIEEIVGMPGRTADAAQGVTTGRLEAILPDGSAVVAHRGDAGAASVARSIVALRAEDAGREVLLAFPDGDPAQPVVLGVLQGGPSRAAVPVTVDGERVKVSAEDELVLQCGKASITLTRAGKVLIRGEYVLSRSAGVNRIKGGSVQIN